MIVSLNTEYELQRHELQDTNIQIQTTGTGTVSLEVSQDGFPFVELKKIPAGVVDGFSIKRCKIKFVSDDAIKVSVVPDPVIYIPE